MQHSYNYTHFLIYFTQRYHKSGRMKRLCLVTVSPTARELHSTTRLKHCVFSTYISSQMTSGHPLIHRWFQALKVLLSFLHLGARKQSYTKRLKWDSESAPGTDTPPSTSRWAVQVPLQTKQVPMLFSETVIIKSLGAAQELDRTHAMLFTPFVWTGGTIRSERSINYQLTHLQSKARTQYAEITRTGFKIIYI